MNPQSVEVNSESDSLLKPFSNSVVNDIDAPISQDDKIIEDMSDRELISNYCKWLSVSSETEKWSHILFEKVKTRNNTEKEILRENQYYALCSIFIASRIYYKSDAECEGEYSDVMNNIEKFDLKTDGISISALRSADKTLKFVELFEMLNTVVAIFKFEETQCYRDIKNAQKRLIITDCIYKEFAEYFMNHYVEGEHYDQLKTFSWIFFLLLTQKISSKLLDFEESLQLFQATLLFIWQNVSPQFKIIGEDEVSIFKLFGVKTNSIKQDMKDAVETLMKQLMEEKRINANKLHDAFLQVQDINAIYEKEFSNSNPSEIDNRLFLEETEDPIGSSSTLLSGPIYQLNPQKISEYVDQHPELQSPMRSPSSVSYRPKSVLHATMRCIQLLKVKLGSENEFPDAELLRFFRSCDTDLTEAIVNRLHTLVNKIPIAKHISEQEALFRTSLIKKTYYLVLKDMLVGEEKRLHRSNFTTLLSNENFHKSHIICSAETVLFAYNMKDCFEFVELLKEFELEAFELSVVIESFVHHANWLNSAFRRHFRTIEEKLLDSLVWKRGSVLYDKIEHANLLTPPPAPGSVTPLAKKRQRVFSVYGNVPNEPDQNQQQSKGSLAVDLFFRKIYRLASARISDLCTEFNRGGTSPDRTIPPERVKQIWHIVWYVLSSKQSLMVDRHVDHMIMCAMYAVCNKLNKMNWISFKDIIHNFRTICENNRNISPVEVGKIFGQVLLDDEKTGDIVKFYNSVFIPNVKDFILQVTPKKDESATIALPDMPQSPQRQRVSKAAKVFVSPLRSPSRQSSLLKSPISYPGAYPANMTPRTRALYSFREAYTERLHLGETQMHTTPGSSVKRVLDFSDVDNASDSPRKFKKLQSGARRSIDFTDSVDSHVSTQDASQDNEH